MSSITSIKDLWIGDELVLLKSKRKGKFDGPTANGKIKVVIDNGKTVITTLKNVAYFTPSKQKIKLTFEDSTPSIRSEIPNQIDLHIEQLAPHLIGQPAPRILDTQVNAFEDYITTAFQHRRMTALIIHGKGEGVLKAEIRHRCEQDERIKLIIDRNQGGATEVWFNY